MYIIPGQSNWKVFDKEKMTKDGKIAGLKGTSNGRSCVSYDCCGEHANLDDSVRFRLFVADDHGKIEEAIQVVRIPDGTKTCTI